MASSSFTLVNSVTGKSLINGTVEIAEIPFSYPFLTLAGDNSFQGTRIKTTL